MFGNAPAPHDEVLLEGGAFTVRYCEDASDIYKAHTGRPLAHLQIILNIPREDGHGHDPVGSDHYYDPPPFRTIAEAGLCVMTWMSDRYGPGNPTQFPKMRALNGFTVVGPAPDDANV